MNRSCAIVIAAMLVGSMPWITRAGDGTEPGPRFKALKQPAVKTSGTWAILDRDGANRQVEPYLSSLGAGESGTGTIVSPTFTVATESIAFTLCGHDGVGGKADKNWIALVDSRTGQPLRKTPAPGRDDLQERAWDVADLQGRQVYIKAQDGLAESAYAWLGIGTIDAKDALRADFRAGLPEGWQTQHEPAQMHTSLVTGGVPFLQHVSSYTWIPSEGALTIPCGFPAKRLYFLGATVTRSQPLEICGWIEMIYMEGPSERYPLMRGFTLDGEDKSMSRSKALYLHPSGDPFQYYLVIQPRLGTIKEIHLCRNTSSEAVPRITAITCQTEAVHENLVELPPTELSLEEEAWIQSHAISLQSPKLPEIAADICSGHRIPAVQFERIKISHRAFEAASVCDVDNDGNLDIVSGGYWYQGPRFTESHMIRDVPLVGEYLDDFCDYPLDVNGDGYIDIITGAYFGRPLQWIENPKGGHGLWKTHDIAPVGPIETVRCWDVDRDGIVEVVPNAGGNILFFRLMVDGAGKGTGQFTKHVVRLGGCGHGLGFGDINGDGRGDFLAPEGWFEGPQDPLAGEWIFHADQGYQLGTASVPIEVLDVNGDGKADILVGQAHGYGLDWYEQQVDGEGNRTWKRHAIDRFHSQYHDLVLTDIDRDGQRELVTGKRYRAHNGHDPGSTDPLFIEYWEMEHGLFSRRVIDYGPPETSSGVGIYFWIQDIDGDGWQDIVAPGKDGLYLFKNRGVYSAARGIE